MAKVVESSGNIFVPFNGSDPDFQQSTVLGSDEPDLVSIISSSGVGLIDGWYVNTKEEDDEVDLYGSAIGVTVELGDGNDEINFENQVGLQTAFLNSSVFGGLGDDFFDLEVGGSGSLFVGGGGEDRFNFGEDYTAITVFGGEGSDHVSVDGYLTRSIFEFGKGSDEFYSYSNVLTTSFTGGSDSDDFYFYNYDFIRRATLIGGDDDDYVYSDEGGAIRNSSFTLGDGDDTFDTRAKSLSDVTVSGGVGNDDIDNYTSTLTNVTLDGGDGDNNIYSYKIQTVVNSMFTTSLGEDIIEFESSSSASTISNTTISSGSGNDTISIASPGVKFTSVLVTAGNGDDAVPFQSSDLDTVTIDGGQGDDQITFTESGKSFVNSLIVAGNGSDTISSQTSKLNTTTVAGGSGDDEITFSESGKSLVNSLITAGDGDDVILSESSELEVVTVGGGQGNDQISFPETGKSLTSSLITGGLDNDVFEFASGAFDKVTLTGGSGDDAITVGGSNQEIVNSLITGSLGEDSFFLEPSITNSTVAGGNDEGDFEFTGSTFTGLRLTAGTSNDHVEFTQASSITGSNLLTGAGEDDLHLTGQVVNTFIALGAGDDDLDFTTPPGSGGFDGVTLVAGSGEDYIWDGDYSLTFVATTITAGDGNDIIDFESSMGDTVAGSGLSIIGGNGDDTVFSVKTGNHTIEGGQGNDSLIAFDGNDIVLAGAGNDIASGGIGNDSINGGSDLDLLFGDFEYLASDSLPGGADTINGGEGADILFGGYVGEDDAGNVLSGGEGSDVVVGGNNNDVIYGYASTTVEGGAANDTVIGAGGNDIIVGSASGSNWLFGDVYGAENLSEENGPAQILAVLANGNPVSNSKVAFADLNFKSNTGLNFYQVNGLLAADEQTPDAPMNENVPSPFGDGDSIAQQFAKDNAITESTDITFEQVAIVLQEGIPNEYSEIQVEGDDSIVGGNGGNIIFGGGGSDTISSGSGTDAIIGGEGDDLITGGSGNDLFIQGSDASFVPTAIDVGTAYTITFDDGVDVITDFKTGTFEAPLEKIAFEGWDGNYVNNLGSPLGVTVTDAIIVYSGTYNPGNNTFATTSPAAGADILAFVAAGDAGIGVLTSGDVGTQAVVLLGAGSSQSISVKNFV